MLGLGVYYNAKKIAIARVRRASGGGLEAGGSSGDLSRGGSTEDDAAELRKERAELKEQHVL